VRARLERYLHQVLFRGRHLAPTDPALVTEPFRSQLSRLVKLSPGASPIPGVQTFTAPDSPAIRRALAVRLLGEMATDVTIVMLCSEPESTVPHLYFEVIRDGLGARLTIDLIPYVDLVEHPTWVEAVYQPLEPIRWTAINVDGLDPDHVTGHHRLASSPWSISVVIDSPGVEWINEAVADVLHHWVGLTTAQLPPVVHTPGDLVARDQAMRTLVAAPRATTRWSRLDTMLGEDRAAELRALIAS